MHILRLFPLILFCILVLGGLQSITAQTPTSPFMVPDTDNHNFHRKCGLDEMIEYKIANDPEYARELERYKEAIPFLVKESRKNAERSSQATILNVPIVVHVIHSGEPIGTGMNLSDAQIQAQIDILNEDFAALNENFAMSPAQWQNSIGNPEVNFCLAAVDPSGNPTNGITRHQMTVTGTDIDNANIETEIKPATGWNSNEYYNIWTLPIPGTSQFGGTTGYAYFPYNGTIGGTDDGTVVDYNWFGGPGFGNTGSGTLTHETGHYLGLPHTFSGNSCNSDDGFADTPNIDDGTSSYSPNLNCGPNNFPTGPTSCGNEHMYINYMDYVNDDYCTTSFSNEQIALMRAVLNGTAGSFGFGSRLPLTNNAVSVCTFFDDDAGVTDILYPGTFICDAGQITPQVVITNFGQSNLNSVNINYQINNNAPVTLIYGTNLATAEKDTVFLAPYTPPAGTYSLKVFTALPNGITDGQIDNDSTNITTLAITPLALPLNEDFETAPFNPTVNGVFVFDNTLDGNIWERSTAASGFGTGTASVMFDNYSTNAPIPTIDALVTPIYNFSAVSGAQLTFDVAYAYYEDANQTLTDTLIVLVSTNCGSNYIDQIFVKGGAELATGGVSNNLFTPNANQWRTETVDLSAYDGEDNLSVMFVNYYGYGNSLFIDNINVSLPCTMTLTSDGTDLFCANECTGVAAVSASGGSGNYTYSWSPNASGATTSTVENLCAGTYEVTVSDGAGCSGTATIVLAEPAALSATINTTDETGVELNNGTATATPVGGNSGYTYAWSNGGGNISMVSSLAPDTYMLTVTDAQGCTVVETFVIAPFDCGNYTVTVDGTNVLCASGTDGTVTATVATGTGTMPFTYAWSVAGSTATIGNLTADTYAVTVTDANGCTGEGSYTVTEASLLEVNVSTTHESLAGTSDGTATANATGGTAPITYSWSNTETTAMIDNLSPGGYTVTATDVNGCTVINDGTVLPGMVDCSSFALGLSLVEVTCFGLSDGVAVAAPSGGATPYTYLWSTSETDPSINGLPAGAYSVTVTDANNCEIEQLFEIIEPSELIVTTTSTDETTAGADDGTGTATPTGGTAPYTYEWCDGQITATAMNLAPGACAVTVTDANGCTEISTVVIGAGGVDCSTFMATTISENVTCNNGSTGFAEAVATGGTTPYSYVWNTNETTAAIGNLIAGVYVVTVSDANNCSSVQEVEITEPTAIIVTTTSTDETTASADDGTGTATPTGGTAPYTYEWCDGQITATAMNLAPGACAVTVTDANGCTEISTVVIGAGGVDCSTFMATTISENVTCNNGSTGFAEAVATGGTTPYSYVWNTNETTAAIGNLIAGVYVVTVSDANNCSSVQEVEVTEPTAIIVTTTSTDETTAGVADGTATATATGGAGTSYIYEWCNAQTTAMATDLPAGTCAVTVTDENGCIGVATVVIGAGGVDCSTFEGTLVTADLSCSGTSDGFAEAIVTGGMMPYTYEWSNNETTPAITNLAAGLYLVTITDINGCQLILETIVGQPLELIVTVSSTDETTAGANNGTATATAAGGSLPYTYEWCNGQTTTTAMNLSPGICEVVVTDANGCTAIETVTIGTGGIDCSTFSGVANAEPVSCFGGTDGIAGTLMVGGMTPYIYNWSSGENTPEIDNLEAGQYTVTILDANDCEVVLTVIVSQPTELLVTTTSTNLTAIGADDGTATATVTGGTSQYSYLWCNGQTTATATNLPEGDCFVVVTDANGCEEEQMVTIGIDGVDCTTFTGLATQQPVSCFGGADGTIQTLLTGGTAPYTYAWESGQNTADLTNLVAGLYIVTVTDAVGCEIIMDAVVSQPVEIIIATTSTNETAAGANDGTATATVTGGSSPYTYSWCNGQTTDVAMDLPAGICEVIVTDANGCEVAQTVFVGTDAVDCSSLVMTTSIEAVTCAGGTDGQAFALVDGGEQPYVYNWNTGATTGTISNMPAGPYSVTITDGLGCTLEESVIISQPLEVSANVVGFDGSCGGNGSASVSGLGGTAPYTYEWSNGMTDDFITGLTEGPYQVTITDLNGCSAEDAVLILVNSQAISMDADVTNVSCYGDGDGNIDMSVISGTGSFIYLWNTGETTQDLWGVPAGVYTLYAADAAGCLYLTTVELGSPAPLNISFATSPADSGSNGSATALVSGGTTPYSYDWNGPQSATINNLEEGPYSVTVTDGNGCSTENTVYLGVSGTGEIASLLSFDLFPNPNNGTFVLTADFSESENVEVIIYNVLGQVVSRQVKEGQRIEVPMDISNQAKGTYMVQLRTEKGFVVRKVVVN